jgi:D-serine deaminase-like pyridoxal phosphate-dependent protein
MLARMRVADLPTPALVVDRSALDHNLATMAAALPGARLRPHVKAHKCTGLARLQRAAGHHSFACATPREVVGMADAGLGDDLLLANETVDPARLRAMAHAVGRVTVAVDSIATIDAAAANGIGEVLVDVNVGTPRCGCVPGDAARLADHARARGLEVRGVMGYEGHVMLLADRAARAAKCEEAMAVLRAVHTHVGGDVVSGGGTGTYDVNRWVTETQAGSYALLDTSYASIVPAFQPALFLTTTVVSVSAEWAVADAGLKSLGMDHGNPAVDDGTVWFCSDEHVTYAPSSPVRVGDRVRVWPAHVDPTIAYHERMWVAASADLEAELLEEWPVDLRGW